MNTNVCAKFRCIPLRIKKALGIFRELDSNKNKKLEQQLEWFFGTRLLGPKSVTYSHPATPAPSDLNLTPQSFSWAEE